MKNCQKRAKIKQVIHFNAHLNTKLDTLQFATIFSTLLLFVKQLLSLSIQTNCDEKIINSPKWRKVNCNCCYCYWRPIYVCCILFCYFAQLLFLYFSLNIFFSLHEIRFDYSISSLRSFNVSWELHYKLIIFYLLFFTFTTLFLSNTQEKVSKWKQISSVPSCGEISIDVRFRIIESS